MIDKNEILCEKAWNELEQWIQIRNSKLWVKPDLELLKKIENSIQTMHDIPSNKMKLWEDLRMLIEAGKKIWK